MHVTATEREQFASRLALISGLVRTGERERALWLLSELRAGMTRRPPASEAERGQLEIALPFPLTAIVDACPLSCPVTVAVCIARQRAGDKRRTKPGRDPELARHDGKRGRAPEAAHCITERCEVGQRVRAALTPLTRGGRR